MEDAEGREAAETIQTRSTPSPQRNPSKLCGLRDLCVESVSASSRYDAFFFFSSSSTAVPFDLSRSTIARASLSVRFS